MSKKLPIFLYPGGNPVDPPTDAIFKWIDQLGGGTLSGPIDYGTLRPDGTLAHCKSLRMSLSDILSSTCSY